MDANVWATIFAAIFTGIIALAIGIVQKPKRHILKIILGFVAISAVILGCFCAYDISEQQTSPLPEPHTDTLLPTSTPAGTLPLEQEDKTLPPTYGPTPTPIPTSKITSPPVPTPTSPPAPTTQSTPPATSTTLSFGTVVSGSITNSIVLNKYNVVLSQAGRLTLDVTRDSADGPAYLTIRWLDSAGVQIRTTNHALSTKYSQYVDLEAGTYYIEIAKYSSHTGVYNLSVDFVSAGNNEVEPNNSRETAQTITTGQTVRGFISYQDSTDFYKVVLPQAGRLTLDVTRDSTLGPAYLTIRWLDSAGAQIRSANHNLSSKYSQYVDLEAGTYYIEITKYSSNTGVYNLSVSS